MISAFDRRRILQEKYKKDIERDKGYWKRVSPSYDDALLMKGKAEKKSIEYETFEDAYMDVVLNELLKKGSVIFIELGCGTGRYMVRYGAMSSENAEHDEVIYDSRFDKNLKAVVGVDFSLPMLEKSLKKMREEGLEKEHNNRIFLINDYAEAFSLAFSRVAKYQKCQKLVCCMFNTLGNIDPEERRLFVLETIHDLIHPDDIGVISVFNQAEMATLGRDYYFDGKIQKLVAPPKTKTIRFESEYGELRTDDFIGHWFVPKRLEEQCTKANLSILDKCIGNSINAEDLSKRGITSIASVDLAKRGIVFKVKAI